MQRRVVARRGGAVVVRAAVHLRVPVRRAVTPAAAAAVQRRDTQPLAAQPAPRAPPRPRRAPSTSSTAGRVRRRRGRRGVGRGVEALVAEMQVLPRAMPLQAGLQAGQQARAGAQLLQLRRGRREQRARQRRPHVQGRRRLGLRPAARGAQLRPRPAGTARCWGRIHLLSFFFGKNIMKNY